MTTNKLKSLVIIVAILMSVSAVAAESTVEGMIDIGKLTCKDLMRGNDKDREVGIAFYQGYFAGKKSEQTLDLHSAFVVTDKVKDYCLSNPTSTVMDAFMKSMK